MYIYGKNTIISYLNSKTGLEVVYLSAEFNDKKVMQLLTRARCETIRVSKNKLNSLTDHANHQGIVAKVFAYQYQDLEALLVRTKDKTRNTVLVLDGLEDPQNFGSMIRTGEALQIDGIIIPKNRSVKVTPTVAKVSTGAINNVAIVQVTNLKQCLKELKNNGYWVVGTDAQTKLCYDELKYDSKIALVIGSEGKGISEQVKANCDYLVKIPMYGQMSSLNAAVSTGIIMYGINSIRNK